METKTGYKLVRRVRQGHLVSCIEDEDGETQYFLGVMISHKDNYGPLCVFEAEEFVNRFWLIEERYSVDFYLYKCEYIPTRKRIIFTDQYRMYLSDLPRGTHLAESVKLIEYIRKMPHTRGKYD